MHSVYTVRLSITTVTVANGRFAEDDGRKLFVSHNLAFNLCRKKTWTLLCLRARTACISRPKQKLDVQESDLNRA